MKKLLYILFAVCLFTACSSDDADDNAQDYTSFQVKSDEKEGTYRNVVAGYKQVDGNYKRIATLGDIAPGKSSDKITIDYNTIKEVELFFDAMDINGNYAATAPLTTIKINEKNNNVYTIPHNLIIASKVNKTNSTQYPVE